MELKLENLTKIQNPKLCGWKWTLRRSARYSGLGKIRNNVIREKNNTRSYILDYVRYKQLNWYGHVQRMGKKGSLEEL